MFLVPLQLVRNYLSIVVRSVVATVSEASWTCCVHSYSRENENRLLLQLQFCEQQRLELQMLRNVMSVAPQIPVLMNSQDISTSMCNWTILNAVQIQFSPRCPGCYGMTLEAAPALDTTGARYTDRHGHYLMHGVLDWNEQLKKMHNTAFKMKG